MISGFLRLGTSYADHFVCDPGTPPIPLTFPNGSGTPAIIPRIRGHRRSSDGLLSHGALFADESDDPICICMWQWPPPHQTVGSDFPSVAVVVTFAQPVEFAVNASVGGHVPSLTIEIGEIFGTVDSRGMVACSRLTVRDGAIVPAALVMETING